MKQKTDFFGKYKIGGERGSWMAFLAPFVLLSVPAHSSTLTWAGNSTAPNNVWNNTSARWNDGVSTVVWGGAGDTAVFGGTAQTVRISASVSANAVVFNSAGYTLSTNVLSLGAGGLDTTALTSGNTTIADSVDGGSLTMTAAQTWKLGTGTTLIANLFNSARVNNGGFNLTLNAAGTTTVNANITGAGGLVKTGAGNVVMGGNYSSFTGNVDIQAGTLTVASASGTLNGGNTVFGIGNSGTKTITVASGATLAGSSNNWFGNQTATVLPTITLNGGNLTTASYSTIGALNLNGAAVNSTSAGSATYQGLAFRGDVTVGGSTASTISATGTPSPTTYGYHLSGNTNFIVADATANSNADLTISAALRNQSADFSSAAGGLTKSGAGKMVLGGANTYTGATVVSAGTLLVNGSLANSATSVASGATVGGSGTIAGAATVSGGGILEGGAEATGTALTLSNNLTLSDGSFIELALGAAGTHSSLLRTGGVWSFDSDQAFTLDNIQSGTYNGIISGLDGTETGLGSIGTWLVSNSGWNGTFTYSGGNVNLTLSAVPEPSTYALLGMGLLSLVILRRVRTAARA